ncbi:MAG: hypothetical protein C0501_14790 [Isosphaera sp.]|nr:hypothetical protein [Isosphaera sp.]
MRHRNRLAWAVVGVLGLTAGPAAAQQIGGINTGGGGGLGGGGQGGGGLGGGGLGGQSMGGAAGGSTGSFQSIQIQAPPQITAPTGSNAGALSQSNFLSGYYTNPMAMGLITNTGMGAGGTVSGPGFGTPLFGNAPSGGGTIGFAGNQTTGTGVARQTGAAGLGSLGGQRSGLGGTGLASNTSAVVVPLPVQFSFPTMPAFPTAPAAAPQLRADITGMLARSAGAISNPAGVQVLTEAGAVVLRGAVASPDEARLVEGMVRLTPGVRAVRNELTFPTAAVLPR